MRDTSMKHLFMNKKQFTTTLNTRIKNLSLGIFIAITFSCLSSCSTTDTDLYATDNTTESSYETPLEHYQQLKASGKDIEAIKFMLAVSEESLGINDSNTVKLIHHYGKLLHEEGEYKEAVIVLLEAQERSVIAFGPFGGPAFQLHMDIAYAYSQKKSSLLLTTTYFDKALEVLRENGQYETMKYITTLVQISTDMMRDGGLKGGYISILEEDPDFVENFDESDLGFLQEQTYENYFPMAEAYLVEAEKLATRLKIKDEYLESKIAIAMARLKVLETQDLAAVTMGAIGGISKVEARESYDQQDQYLQDAIKNLSRDAEQNGTFINMASKARMDIAWMSKDEERMANMCTDGQLDMTGQYSSGRLFEVLEGGKVDAPSVDLWISKNLFKGIRSLGKEKRPSNRRGKTAHFIPVCIDGRLMAALINAPTVTISDN